MEVKKKTVEKKYVTLNGNEYPYGDVYDVVDGLIGTSGFIEHATLTHIHGEIGDDLQELGFVSRTASGGYYSNNDDGLEGLLDEMERLADEL